MEYKVDFDVNEFKFWSGAKDTIADVERYDLMEELGNLIEETFADTMPTDTEINDYVWFERDEIYSRLGLNENGERETDKFPIGTKVVVINSAGIPDGTIATITGYNEDMNTYPLEVEYPYENEMKENDIVGLDEVTLLNEVYLDYFNNGHTAESLADKYYISEEQAKKIIKVGREEHEKNCAK